MAPLFKPRCFLFLFVQRELLFCQSEGSLVSFAAVTLGRYVTTTTAANDTRGTSKRLSFEALT